MRGHAGAINAVAFSPNNHWLATAGGFDLTTSTWDTTVRLWDLTAPDRAVQPIILSGHEQDVTVVAFSPDTHWLVTGGSDKTVRLWDLTAPDVRATGLILHGHTEFIDAISFSADSHWLVTGSYDHTARIWNLRPNELVDLACRTAGRNLTDKEWSTYFPGQPYPKICPNLPPGDGVPPNAPAATP